MTKFLDEISKSTGQKFYYLKLYACTNLFNLNEDPHFSLKRQLGQFFNPQLIGSYRPSVLEVISSRLDSLSKVSDTDLIESYINPTASSSIYKLLGLSLRYHDQYQSLISSLLRLTDLSIPISIKGYYHLEQEAKNLYDLITSDLADAAAQPLAPLSFYRFYADKDQFSHEQTVSYMMVLLAAGISMRHTLANLIVHLFSIPANLRKSFLECNSQEQSIEKLLYISGGVRNLFRLIADPEDASELRANPGDMLVLGIANANLEVIGNTCPFSTANQYTKNENFAFGKGVHRCIGESFSRMFLEIALLEFAERYPNASLLDDYIANFSTTSKTETLFVKLR